MTPTDASSASGACATVVEDRPKKNRRLSVLFQIRAAMLHH
jgi:hypothetical protein